MPVNTAILTVGATDLDTGVNAEIQYSLFGIGVEDFYMDANTGISVQTLLTCAFILLTLFISQLLKGVVHFQS